MKEQNVKRIAFFFYGYNLAETTRAIEVASALRKKGVETEFFSHGGPHSRRPDEAGFKNTLMLPEVTEKQHKRFMDLDQGRARGELYSPEEWVSFARSEIEILKKFKPDAVYAGFNLSSVLSTRAVGCPLIFLVPAQAIKTYYQQKLGSFPEFMENAFTRIIPQGWKDSIFNYFMSKINYLPIDNINKAADVLQIKRLENAFDILTGDLMLLSDLEQITGMPAAVLPKNHYYMGPLFANLPMEVPAEVRKVFSGKEPKIFCAMGSSGSAEILRVSLNALKKTDYRVVGAVTSIMDPEEFAPFSDRFYVTRYLPAAQVNELADLAVTHGGQGTLQNSVWAGKPMVGVPFQFEQQMNLDMMVRAGTGIKIKMHEYTGERLLQEVKRILENPSYSENAKKLSTVFRNTDGAENAAKIIIKYLNERGS